MNATDWQLKSAIDVVVFDCDGTLTRIEGIDELAAKNGVGQTVKSLTATAMGKTGINEHIYQQRLSLVRPTRKQVIDLGQEYFSEVTEDAFAVIQALQRLQKKIYVLSAGLRPAVSIFAELLKIPRENIFAVDIVFNAQEEFLDFDHTSPLVNNDGKYEIVKTIKSFYPNMVYVGDGLNDLSTFDLVTRFIGYGGSYYYEKIAEKCEFYINTPTLAPLLPLALIENELTQLNAEELEIYQKGLHAIEDKKVIIK